MLALASGATYAEAAERMGIAPNTVKRMVTDTYGLLGATCLVEAFLALGWLVPGRLS